MLMLLVEVAVALAWALEESLLRQRVEWSELKAVYRLFDCPAVTFDGGAGPHGERRQEWGPGRFLWISDTTSLNLTPPRKISGLGPLGREQGYGFLWYSSLMLQADTSEVLELAGQRIWCRPAKSAKR